MLSLQDFLVNEFYMWGDDEPEVRAYSGRGMYGAECLGVTCDDPVVLAFTLGRALGEHNTEASNYGEELVTIPRSICTDSMGLRHIVYFPGVPYVDEPYADEDPNE